MWHLPQLPGPPFSSCGGGGGGHYSSSSSSSPKASPLTRLYSSGCGPVAGGGGGGLFAGTSGGLHDGVAAVGAAAVTEAASCVSESFMRASSPTATASAGVITTTSPAAASAAGVSVSVLQHTCFVYAAELHPTQQPWPTVVTAGFDGVLRLWSMEGVVLYSLVVSLCVCGGGGLAVVA